MKRIQIIFSILLFCCMLSGCSQEGAGEEADKKEQEGYVIGVSVFDPSNPEMKMFKDYYETYLEDGFPVEFVFSDKLSSGEDEREFISEVKEQGAKSIISFYGLDIQKTMELCQEEEIYFVLGSGTISEEDLHGIQDNPWFLGTIGPDPVQEYQTGKDMVSSLEKNTPENYLILTGGAGAGNFMHEERARGMLEQLQALGKVDETADIEEMLSADENQSFSTADGAGKITLCPGYMEETEGRKNLEAALETDTYDALLCTYGVSEFLEDIEEKESEQGKNIAVGTIDCFSEENKIAIEQNDPYGNPEIDYIAGKYASMVGPAFAVAYNAITGHPEANTEDGRPVQFYQGFWQAQSREEFIQLYDYTQGMFDNAYSSKALMGVIKAFNEETAPEDLKELAEAYTVEKVLERMQK